MASQICASIRTARHLRRSCFNVAEVKLGAADSPGNLPTTSVRRRNSRNVCAITFDVLSRPQTLVIHTPALPLERSCHPTIALPAELIGRPHDVFHQARLIVAQSHVVALRAPWLAQHPACPALEHTHGLLCPTNRLSPFRRAQKSPDAASFRIWLSRGRSATSFFRRAFSFSSSFIRFAWSRRRPPYSFRQR